MKQVSSLSKYKAKIDPRWTNLNLYYFKLDIVVRECDISNKNAPST